MSSEYRLRSESSNITISILYYKALAKAKSEAVVNIYSLLKQDIKSCIAERRRQRKRNVYQTFFGTILCRCFARLQLETSRHFLVTCFIED